MMAVGRVANSKGIGLERVGVEVDKDGKIKGMFNEELE
jgi:pyruvate/2-oxoglutarate dehydrogenase complex dihydrolipoamide dehydrogenase (E3) component